MTPDAGVAGDDRVRADDTSLADLHLRADHGVGTDLDVRRQAGVRMDAGGRIDHVMALSVHMISAEATSVPSTLALQVNIQMPRTARFSCTSMRS